MRLTDFLAMVLLTTILILLVLPKLNASDCRKSGRSLADLRIREGSLQQFKNDCGRYPTTAEGLEALEKPPLRLKQRLIGPYVESKRFTDPWGGTYRYQSDGKSFRLYSLGADGQPGGEGEDADLIVTG